MAWTVTYTSVVWTSGDLITETKLDNMVANDQAYDAFTSSGLILDNNVFFSSKDTGAARRAMIGLNASDAIVIGANNVNDHTIINAGSSKLVKIKVLRQNITSNDYEENTVLLTGWGYVQGDGTIQVELTVTFGITFSAAPIVLISKAGAISGSNPTLVSDFNISDDNFGFLTGTGTDQITTTNFAARKRCETGNVWNAAWRVGWTWIAVGELN